MKMLKIAAAVTFLTAAPKAFAQNAAVNGEVKKVDEAAAKITLKHGPIKNLDMDDDDGLPRQGPGDAQAGESWR